MWLTKAPDETRELRTFYQVVLPCVRPQLGALRILLNQVDHPPQDCPLVGIEIAGWQPPASQRVKYLRVSSMSHENSGFGFPPGWYRTPRPRRRQKSPKTHW